MSDDIETRTEFFASEMNRRLIRSLDPYIDENGNEHNFHVYFDRHYHVDKAKKFYYIRDNDANQHFPKGYVFVKIDMNGDIFRPNGKKSLGSIYSEKSGTEYLDTLNFFSK